MCSKPKPTRSDAQKRLETAYESERPRLLARLRKAGRTLEEAEDLIHDVYAETMEQLPVVATVRNLPARERYALRNLARALRQWIQE
jgi:predicted RNA polymerase sigma factor